MLTKELKETLPKPKPKTIDTKPKNDKEICDICGREFKRSGIKSHKKACLKKQELKKIQDEIEKLEIEETLEELEKEDPELDLDKLTEDVTFIEIPKDEGD